jgi:hypothetical protein
MSARIPAKPARADPFEQAASVNDRFGTTADGSYLSSGGEHCGSIPGTGHHNRVPPTANLV